LNAKVFQNIDDIAAAAVRLHRSSGWLNALASLNIQLVFCTRDTSQSLRGWLNLLVEENINHIPVTEETFHFDSGWLKA
jgi:hypothetical protein